MRFASFIEGESHLTDAEMLSYEVDRDESSAHTSDISDDEEIIDEEEEDEEEEYVTVKENGSNVNTPNGRSRSSYLSRRH